MKFLLVILYSTLSLSIFAQSPITNDTVAVYKKVLDSLFKSEKVIATTEGKVVYADIYGNYDKMRRWGDSVMEAQGKIFVMWVEPEQYQKSVATILRENKIAFDTIKLEDVVWTRPVNLQSFFPAQQFVKADRAPLGHSFFDNFFKEKRTIRLSELLFVKGLNIAVVKAKIDNRSNKGEWFEMIVLHKDQNEWKILDRTKSSS
jgi:hypothetical protein